MLRIILICALAKLVRGNLEDIYNPSPVQYYDSKTQVEIGPAKQGCGWRNEGGIGERITETESRDVIHGEFPWVVAIYRYNGSAFEYLCVGSLIHPKIVMSVEHYFERYEELRIVAGEHEVYGDPKKYNTQAVDVEKVELHPRYNSYFDTNDVALLFLKKAVKLSSSVGLVCLPPAGHAPPTGQLCIATGWGYKNFRDKNIQTILKMTELPIIGRDDCESRFREVLAPDFYLQSSHLCAGGDKDKDTCTKDGGAPLVCPYPKADGRFYQAGIVSWGVDCGLENVPGGYTNVEDVREWIDRTVASKGYNNSSYTP